jgi:hypothetical protein
VAVVKDDDWLTTHEPVSQVTWVYAGDVHDELRPGPTPAEGPEAFAYLGPVLLRMSADGDPLPLFSDSCGKTVRFMSRPAGLAAQPSRPFRTGSTRRK